ncbi:hypothetical protein [Actinocorallia sp. A-T 12471]|uniref:hypothetical protein n=1 Tax=Actinocorallia sp. A-T 12471 TaxID=3089813 RepID=UPI0029CF9DAC|nr:hypothetical protein [Actinocorallia sp. A-T 12471]MDX6738840.1 hypothetical protein [Actinocorallia sp. A-T 12471]
MATVMWSISKLPIGNPNGTWPMTDLIIGMPADAAAFPKSVCAQAARHGEQFGYGSTLGGESVLTRVREDKFGAQAPCSWRPPV